MNTTLIFYFVNELLLESRSRFNVLKALIPLFSLNLLLFIISIALARLYLEQRKGGKKEWMSEQQKLFILSFFKVELNITLTDQQFYNNVSIMQRNVHRL